MNEPAHDKPSEPGGKCRALWFGVSAAIGLVLMCAVGWCVWCRSKAADHEQTPAVLKHAEAVPAEAPAPAAPVAVAVASPNPLKTAQRGNKNDTNILVLDGTRSQPAPGNAADGAQTTLTYQWAQVSGTDLKLRPSPLAKSRVGLRVFQPGTYRFRLVVSDGRNESAPSDVDVVVVDGRAPPDAGADEVRPAPGAGGGALAVKLPKTVEGVVGEQIRIEAQVSGAINERVTYQWECKDPADLVVPEKLARNSILIFMPKIARTYVFKVTVGDGDARRTEAEVVVIANAAPNR